MRPAYIVKCLISSLLAASTFSSFAGVITLTPNAQINSAYDFQSLTCSDQLLPNRLVISGGVSAESIRPKDGSDQLDKQMAAIRTYVESKGGNLLEKEKLRAARNLEKSSDVQSKFPYIQVQRIEAEFPLTANADEAIEKLLKLGMDRYGRDAGIDAYSGRDYKNLSFYRIGKQDEVLADMVSQCVRKEVQKICPQDSKNHCKDKINIQTAVIQTEAFSNRDGYKNAQHISIIENGIQLHPEAIESLGSLAIRLRLIVGIAVAHGATIDGDTSATNKKASE
ncbi:hypothetical protein ACO0LF_00285 [Undibacterium sp. Di27W]|uniref:hypothetical protein n=1 Tax=Undibacterium sp. Di27W TaxID=3413036 RepID=UPI003BF3879A